MNLELFSIVIAFCGFAFGLYQFHENSKIKRAETLSKLIFRLWSDEEIRSVVNMFEYNDNWFDTDFHGTEKEIIIDKTLQYLSFICYLYKHGILQEDEFNLFRYEISHLFKNRSAIKYMEYLFSFSRSELGKGDGIPFPFKALLSYGLENNLIKGEVFSS